MLKVFMAGQAVPEWLEKITPNNDQYVRPSVTFNHPSVVYVKNGQYQVRSIISPRQNKGVLKVSNGKHFTMSGQSPSGTGKPVIIHASPVFYYFEILLLTIIAVGSVFIFK